MSHMDGAQPQGIPTFSYRIDCGMAAKEDSDNRQSPQRFYSKSHVEFSNCQDCCAKRKEADPPRMAPEPMATFLSSRSWVFG
jgi:hypothetical protein